MCEKTRKSYSQIGFNFGTTLVFHSHPYNNSIQHAYWSVSVTLCRTALKKRIHETLHCYRKMAPLVITNSDDGLNRSQISTDPHSFLDLLHAKCCRINGRCPAREHPSHPVSPFSFCRRREAHVQSGIQFPSSASLWQPRGIQRNALDWKSRARLCRAQQSVSITRPFITDGPDHIGIRREAHRIAKDALCSRDCRVNTGKFDSWHAFDRSAIPLVRTLQHQPLATSERLIDWKFFRQIQQSWLAAVFEHWLSITWRLQHEFGETHCSQNVH